VRWDTHSFGGRCPRAERAEAGPGRHGQAPGRSPRSSLTCRPRTPAWR
jgi:hypothetical protein